MTLLWAHSGDSHFLEPEDLWHQILPPKLAERMPRSEKVDDNEEIVHVDGKSFRRQLPKVVTKKGADGQTIGELSVRPPGARDPVARLQDLDAEGVWGEVMYASLGLVVSMIEDRELVRDAARAENEWKVSEIQASRPTGSCPRRSIPLLDVDDAVAELQHAADDRPARREPAHRRARRGRRLEPRHAGSRCGPRPRRRAWCSASTSAPTASDQATRRSAAPAAPSSTTSRPPTAASAPP